MNILVMGSGGVGGYFGAKLARAGEAVTFVARGAHLDAIRTHDKRLELEALHGHAVRLGARLGAPTPMCFAVYAALKPYLNGPPA